MQTHVDATRAYTKRFDAVLAYIDMNIEGDLSVEALSGIANFSKFHFHRQFAAYVGSGRQLPAASDGSWPEATSPQGLRRAVKVFVEKETPTPPCDRRPSPHRAR